MLDLMRLQTMQLPGKVPRAQVVNDRAASFTLRHFIVYVTCQAACETMQTKLR